MRGARGTGTLGGLLTGLALAAPAAAAERWTLAAPGGGRDAARAVVTLDAAGRPSLALSRGPRLRLPAAPLGVVTGRGDLGRGLRALSASRPRVLVERYRTPAGKRRRHASRLAARVLRLAGPGGERLDVELRVAADGVAFRYRLPGRGPHRVRREHSAVRLPVRAPSWTSPYQAGDPAQRDPSNLLLFYEAGRTQAPVAELRGDLVHPALFELGRDAYALVSEAGLDGGYVGTHLRAEGDGLLRFAFPLPPDAPVGRGPLVTPWRMVVLGSLADVVESDLGQDLAHRSRLRDESWVRPGSVAWSWNADPASAADFETQRRYVRYAARQSWPYVLVDEGWSPRWMPRLVAYARRRGVGVFLWTRYSRLRTRAERAASLARWARWGVAGVKIDFLLCDCQARLRWLDDVLARTARLKLLVNLHGTTIPRGLERTWPQLLTVEGVQGGEFYNAFRRLGLADSVVPLTPLSLTTLPFTRNAVGPMDFTPVLFSSTNRATSEGFELGTAVAYESGLQHWADGIAGYAERPRAERLLADVPVAWDETRLVAGRPGAEAVLARRRGGEWWVGALSATGPRRSRVPLRFLGPGRWRLELVGDDGRGGLRGRSGVARRTSRLETALAANGGYLARLTPVGRASPPPPGATATPRPR